MKQYSSKPYILYGNDLSLFTRKLEAALIFYGADFSKQANTAELAQRAATHQIPVLLTPENWALADTTPIMQMLDGRFPARNLYAHGLQGLLIRVLEEYLDEWVARVMVHYRWHYPENAQFAAIRLGNGDETVAQFIASWGPRACRATGTESAHQQQAAEDEYVRLLEAAENQLKHSAYLLGDRPCAVDAMMLGGLRGHTYADPGPKRKVSEYRHIVKWLEKQADQWDGKGELAPMENPTGFAQHILREMPTTYQPFVLGNKNACEQDSKFFITNIYGEDVSYLMRPYPETSRQMIVNFMAQHLSHTEQEQATAWLKKVKLHSAFS